MVPSSRNPTGPNSSIQIVNALGLKKSSSTRYTQISARSTAYQSSSSGRTRWTTMHSTGTTTHSPGVPMRTLPLGNSVPSFRVSCSPLRMVGSILRVRWQVRTMRGLRERWTRRCGWWMKLSAGISRSCYPGLRRSTGGAWCLVTRRVRKRSLFAGCFRRSWRRLKLKLWVLEYPRSINAMSSSVTVTYIFFCIGCEGKRRTQNGISSILYISKCLLSTDRLRSMLPNNWPSTLRVMSNVTRNDHVTTAIQLSQLS